MLRRRESGEPNNNVACNPLNPTYTMSKANEEDTPFVINGHPGDSPQPTSE